MRTTSNRSEYERIFYNSFYNPINYKCDYPSKIYHHHMIVNKGAWDKLVASINESTSSRIILCQYHHGTRCLYISFCFVGPNKTVYWRYISESICYNAITDMPYGFVREVVD